MTHRCHLRCLHCYLGQERFEPPPGGELDTAFWCSVIDQIAEAGCLNLLITGGEPLLRPDFPEVYTRARTRGMLVEVFTNGTLVDAGTVSLFERFTPSQVEITLYGASPEVYERVTGARGAYRRCLDGIDALLAARIQVGLKAVILDENCHEIGAMREIARERCAPFRVDAALFPRRDGDMTPLSHRVSPSSAVALEYEDEDLRTRSATTYMKVHDIPPPAERLFGCGAALTSFHIDPQGALLPCLMVSSHGFDLRQGSFQSGWESALATFVEQKSPPSYECHRCEKRFLCGVCPAQSAMETGSPTCKSEYVCQLGDARLRALRLDT